MEGRQSTSLEHESGDEEMGKTYSLEEQGDTGVDEEHCSMIDTDLSLGEINPSTVKVKGVLSAGKAADLSGGSSLEDRKPRSSTMDSNDSGSYLDTKLLDGNRGDSNEEKDLIIGMMEAQIARIQQKYYDLKEEMLQSKGVFNEEKKALLAKISSSNELLKQREEELKEKSLTLVQKNGELSSLRAHYAALRKRGTSSEGATLEGDEEKEESKGAPVELEDVVYENQRSLLFGGFSVKYLIPKVDSRENGAMKKGIQRTPLTGMNCQMLHGRGLLTGMWK